MYSLAMAVIAEITPIRHVGTASGLMGSVFAMSSILGPILGGVITSNTTWRWVFYLKCVLFAVYCRKRELEISKTVEND